MYTQTGWMKYDLTASDMKNSYIFQYTVEIEQTKIK